MADGVEAVEVNLAENANWARTVKDLAAGAAGGVAQVLLGEHNHGEDRASIIFRPWDNRTSPGDRRQAVEVACCSRVRSIEIKC
jgi:hypothetical protein